MTTLVFTICARNYIGLAKVLGLSVGRHSSNVDFRIFVADGLEDHELSDPSLISAPHALEDIISRLDFVNMAFMYNITEFCTSIKAACFIHGFDNGYDKCVYMDPDTLLVADFQYISKELDDNAIVITPHLCLPNILEGPRADHGILATGVYNLGFLGLRRDREVTSFLHWWDARLRSQAFNDHYKSLYTDQRWIDFVPSLFSAEAVGIWRHLGCNVAPWNYHERLIEQSHDGFIVRPRRIAEHVHEDVVDWPAVPLIFLHFSGFDFRKITDGRFTQLNLSDAETYSDLLPIYKLYGDAIGELAGDINRQLSRPYGFDRFSDGSAVLPSHRRLFRVWRERHGNAADPFAIVCGSFYAAIASRGLLGQSGPSDLAADKSTMKSIHNPERLTGNARSVFRIIFWLLGRARFFILIRGLNRFANVEQHYDTFRIDDAYIKTDVSGQASDAC